MVAIMASATPRERLAGLIDSTKVAPDISSKLDHLRCLSEELLQDDPVLLAEFLPLLLDLTSDRFSPVRKFIIQMTGEIGMKQPEFLPEIVPVLISFLNDESPPVARQAIACGLDLFRCTFQKIAIQGLFSSELDDSLESSWGWMLNFKDKIYDKAFKPVHKPGRNGIKLLALKFVEAIVLLFTPDPNGCSEPPPHQTFGGNLNGFNISWLRSGHPVLNVGDLSIEASQRLGLLLDQLRFPTVKSLSSLTIIVLVNSLSAVAKKRPAFYGRILPVLLGLDPTSFVTNSPHLCGACHALKNAFISCLESTHPGAAPWRDRLLLALKEIQDGQLAKKIEHHDYKINENKEREDDFPEEKVTVQGIDLSTKVRKRTEAEDSTDQTSENEGSGKRVKPSRSISEESTDDLRKKSTIFQDENASSRPSPPKANGSSGAVLQLVALFGTLVAQGDTAAASLDILISSISADLLAEVVMANMSNLPMERPKADEEGAEQEVFSLSSAFPQIASILDAQQPVSNTDLKCQEEEAEDVLAADDSPIVESEKIDEEESSVLPTAMPVTDATEIEGLTDASTDLHETGNLEIPGLTSITNANMQSEIMLVASMALTDVEDTSQEQDTRLAEKPALDVLPSISNDRSAELSAKTMSVDESIQIASTATSIGLPSYVVLPKMSAPVVNLSDEQRDQLQQVAFSRIVEAYKDAEAAGFSQTRFALLSHIGVEFPSELDPWKLLQQHIVSDYMNHEGHELTLRLLYRLFGEAEVESDFFSSTTATSAYEMLLLSVAETLKDSFPASDKSLSRLLGEVPHLPTSVLKLLESLCSPSNTGTPEESQSGDRVTQGLSAVWSLILQRPPVRSACLKIALQSTIHHLEEVRMKAIRLVANKLYPLPSISQQIEEFAKNMLFSVTVDGSDKVETEKSATESSKVLQDSAVEKVEHTTEDLTTKEIPSDTRLPSSEESQSNSLAEAQRCMSLYFALCTKKHSLFGHIFMIYERASKAAKEAIHRHIPILVRTMGASSAFLEIISDAPSGSVNLLTQVLRTLTDGAAPTPELIRAIRKLYDTKLKDVEILMPILPFLQKEEVLSIFPHLLNLPSDKFQAALLHILKGSSHAGPTLSPEEALIAIHGIDPERDGIPLKKITDACNACFEQKEIFTQQVVAKVLNQLVEQTPLPLLFMRTVLQSIGAFPGLVVFIMDILGRLVRMHIWKYPKLWVGFLKCAVLTKPHSFDVLLQVPPAQLVNALNRTLAPLKEPLIAHASQHRSTIPRSTLVALGIISDSQAASSQAQSLSQTQTQASQAESSSQMQTQVSEGPSSSQTQASQDRSSGQTQTLASQDLSSGAQATQSPTTVDTGTSDKEEVVVPEKEASSSVGG